MTRQKLIGFAHDITVHATPSPYVIHASTLMQVSEAQAEKMRSELAGVLNLTSLPMLDEYGGAHVQRRRMASFAIAGCPSCLGSVSYDGCDECGGSGRLVFGC